MTVAEHIASQTKLQRTPEEGKLLITYLLHFNCMGHHEPFFNEENWKDPSKSHVKAFMLTVMHYVHYKYVWLNKGDGAAELSMETHQDLRYWDERLAGKQFDDGYD
ncbi:hypothetical protein HGRIS_014275 [Hohenbuehelia grisea]|uniref:Uncharacterized protein n=1 Tax=Hohenbuehelia grisea TaxID=104357 RepID=A0ABR3JV07_9AGAR